MNPSQTGSFLTFVGSIFVSYLSRRNSGPSPDWKTGIMEYWNDGIRRKTINLLFSILIPIIPLFQQSIIPILQKITLMENGVDQKLRRLPPSHRLAIVPNSGKIRQ